MAVENQYKAQAVLLGDIGGTNIRLELVVVKPPSNYPQRFIKRETLLVQHFSQLHLAIQKFLQDVSEYPTRAVLALAGPIYNNACQMANALKWGVLSGGDLASKLNIKTVKLINDFQANSYGIMLVPEDQFISLNGRQVIASQTRGIVGPGTGLGNSILFSTPFRKRERVYVLASEGGHTDAPYIDDQVQDYYKALLVETGSKMTALGLEYVFCGPALPFMVKYFMSKHPQLATQNIPSNFQIITRGIEQPECPIYGSVIRLFLKIYSSAVGNFMAHHMCTGGVYLVGSLTNSLLPVLNEEFLSDWQRRHPQLPKISEIPLVVCTEIDLGLKGAYYMARRIISDEQHQ